MKYVLFLIIGLSWFGCRNGAEDPPSFEDKSVLATFANGQVTQEDLDQVILAMPPQLKPQTGTLPEALRSKLIRKVALDAILLDQAQTEKTDAEPEFQAMARQLKRQVFSQQYLRKHRSNHAITQLALQDFFEQEAATYQHPEKRHVLHIFRRKDDADDAQTLALLRDIRDKMMQGANWADLAREFSQSESRHKGGDLGLITRGKFSRDFDDIVFALPKGEPSEPIATEDGFHLFFIQSSIDAFTPELADIRPQVLKDYQQWVITEQRKQLSEALPLPENAHRENWETVQRYLTFGEPTLELFRMGSYRLQLAEFTQTLLERSQQGSADRILRIAEDLFEEIWDLERIYQHLEKTEAVDPDHPQFQKLRRQKLAEYQLHKQLQKNAVEDEPALQQFFEANQMRFASPPRVQMQRLLVPIGKEPTTQMAAMETLRDIALTGKMTADQVAGELGGQLQMIPLSTPAQLQQIDPRAPVFCANLVAGGVSPPYRVGPHLVMLFLQVREQPQAQPFERVKAQVAHAYFTQNLQRVYEAYSATLLERHDFTMR